MILCKNYAETDLIFDEGTITDCQYVEEKYQILSVSKKGSNIFFCKVSHHSIILRTPT